MNIEVLTIRLTNTGSSLHAFVDVKIGTWIINDWRVWQQNGRAYVSVPQSSWRDPSGQIKFKPILTIPPEQKQQIDIEILHAYQAELEQKNADNKQ